MGFEFGKGALWCVLNIALDRFIVAEQMRAVGIEPAAILLEPVGRGSAPVFSFFLLHQELHASGVFFGTFLDRNG